MCLFPQQNLQGVPKRWTQLEITVSLPPTNETLTTSKGRTKKFKWWLLDAFLCVCNCNKLPSWNIHFETGPIFLKHPVYTGQLSDHQNSSARPLTQLPAATSWVCVGHIGARCAIRSLLVILHWYCIAKRAPSFLITVTDPLPSSYLGAGI